MPAIGKPPMTHVHTSAGLAGQTEAFTFDPKTNHAWIRSASAWSFAYRGTTPAALPTAGDNAGVGVTAGAWKELTVSTGTDRVAGIEVLVQHSVNAQVYEIEAEE